MGEGVTTMLGYDAGWHWRNNDGDDGSDDRGQSSGVAAPGHCLVNEEDQANVGHDVEEVRGEAPVEALETLVPPSLTYAVPQVVVVGVLVLHARSQHLVWVGGDCGKQLGEGGKGEVFHHCLQRRRWRC